MTSKGNDILIASAKLFRKKGFKAVTMDEISSELKMSKKTLYKFFKNKRHLIESLIKWQIKEEKCLISSLSEDTENAVAEMVKLVDHMMKMFDEVDFKNYEDLKIHYPDTYSVMDTFLQVHIYNRIHTNIQRGISEGLYHEEINPDIMARMYVVKVAGIMEEHAFPSQKYDKKILIRNLIEYHIRAIVNAKGLKIFEETLKKDY